MITDALDGKIDVILVKSVSRFARNTIDALQTTRDLKLKGVPVFFEKENIDSMDPKGEFIFVVRKSYKTQKAQDLVGLVLFCYHILWFAPFAEYLNLGAAF